MPSINIKKEHLQELLYIFEKFIPDAEVWAYGSRVDGNCHEGSDLDLVIRNKIDLNAPVVEISKIKTSITNSNIPFLVDIHDWALLPEYFRTRILRNYVVVY